MHWNVYVHTNDGNFAASFLTGSIHTEIYAWSVTNESNYITHNHIKNKKGAMKSQIMKNNQSVTTELYDSLLDKYICKIGSS